MCAYRRSPVHSTFEVVVDLVESMAEVCAFLRLYTSSIFEEVRIEQMMWFYKYSLVGLLMMASLTVCQAETVNASDSLLKDTTAYHHTELRTNLLYLATATFNASIDYGLTKQWSLSMTVGYNPFKWPQRHRDDDKVVNPKTLHWLLMPEVKYWFTEHLNGLYVGGHAIYAQYNIGGISFIPALNNNRYDGNLFGTGVSVGWHKWIGKRTALDFSFGLGYLHLHYDKYKACKCSGLLGIYNQNYFGPTKMAVSLAYLIK